jgi:hypothetical protein
METIHTNEAAFVQRMLLFMGALVAVLIVAASTAFVVRHYTGGSDPVAPATTHQTVTRGSNGDSSSGYRETAPLPANGGAGVGAGPARHQ